MNCIKKCMCELCLFIFVHRRQAPFANTTLFVSEFGITSDRFPAQRAFLAGLYNLVGANSAEKALVSVAAVRELAIGHVIIANCAGVLAVLCHCGWGWCTCNGLDLPPQ